MQECAAATSPETITPVTPVSHIIHIYNIISPGFVEQGLLQCVKVPKLRYDAECSMFQVCVNLLRGQNSTGECLMVTLQTSQS